VASLRAADRRAGGWRERRHVREHVARAGAGCAVLTAFSRWPSEVEVQIVFGDQTRRNRIRHAIELIAAMTSTSSGPM
jgi:hypothetical protein